MIPPDSGTFVESNAPTVISAVPLKLTPLMVLAVCKLEAVAALPVTLPTKLAVIVPAEKLPLASLATILFAVFVLEASTLIVTGIDEL